MDRIKYLENVYLQDYREVFEDIANMMFCTELGLEKGVDRKINQRSIESDPVYIGGKRYAYQAKYYDVSTKLSAHKKDLITCVNGAASRNVTDLFLYINKDLPDTDSDTGKEAGYIREIEDVASRHSIILHWRPLSLIEASLEMPKYVHIKNLYFGHGNIKGYYDYVVKLYKKPNIGNMLLGEESLSELYIPLYYYETRFEFGDVENLLEEFYSEGEGGVLWIVGEPGHGKTSMCIKAVADYRNMERYQQAKGVFWFRLNPQGIPGMVKPKMLALENVFSWGRIHGNRSYTIDPSEIEGSLVFLDGFDELKFSLDEHDISNEQFYDQVNQLALEYKMHIVITTRTQTLIQEELCTIDRLKNGKGEIHCNYLDGEVLINSVKLLAPLTKRQQTEWVKKYLECRKNNNENTSELEEYLRWSFPILQENESISALLEVPIILRMLVNNRFVLNNNNLVGLYRELFDKTLYRQGLGDQREALYKIYCEIAFRIFVNDDDSTEISKGEFAEITGSDAYLYQYYLNPVDEAGRRLTFSHRSIYQYFLSEFLYNKLIAVNDEKSGENFLECLWPRHLDIYVLHNLQVMSESCEVVFSCIFSAIEETSCFMNNYKYSYQGVFLNEDNKRSNVFWNAVSIINCISKRNVEYPKKVIELLSKLDVEGIYLRNAILRGVDLSRANLRIADLRNADLSNANLSNTDLESANLSNVNLRSAIIKCANLSYADLSNADIREANLESSDLSYVNLNGSDLSYAKLFSANLKSANLRDVSLCGARLENVNLVNATLNGADLRGAVFRNAELSSTDLTYTDLSNADLSSANLSSSDIRKANIENTLLSGAIFKSATVDKEQLVYLQKQDIGYQDTVTAISDKEPIIKTKLPKPYDYRLFKELCMDILSIKFNVTPTVVTFKQGFEWDFSFEDNGNRYIVECKHYKSVNSGKMLIDNLQKTISKMEKSYDSKFDTYILMTTLNSNDALSKTLRSIQIRPFNLQVWFWEDLENTICSNDSLMHKYYPNVGDFLGGCYINYKDCILINENLSDENRKKKIEIILPEEISRAYHIIRNKNYTLEFPDGRVTYLTATGSEDTKDDYASSLIEMAHVKDELLLVSWIKNHNKDEEYVYLEFYGSNRILLKQRYEKENVENDLEKIAVRFEETTKVSETFIRSVVSTFDGFRLISLKIVDKGYQYCDFEFISNESTISTLDLFSTAIIGNNGAGKSYILKFISELFYSISTSEPGKQIVLDKDQYEISYILKRHIYHISIRSGNAVFRKDNISIKPTIDEIISMLPNSIIALSFTLDDKFKYITKEENKSKIYKYLGVKHTDYYDILPYVINEINENFIRLARKNYLRKFIKKVCHYLDFDPILCISYSISTAVEESNAKNLRNEGTINKDLSNQDLSYSDLRNENFSGYVLSGANFEGSNLEGANLSYTNLENANLFKANLRNADLNNANLKHADLRKAVLADAYFRNATLEGADLSGTDCSKAYFRDADLSFSNLENTNLENALLFGANNIEAAYIKNTRLPEDYIIDKQKIVKHLDSYKSVDHKYSSSKTENIHEMVEQININHQISYNDEGVFKIYYDLDKEQIDEKLLLTKNYLYEQNIENVPFAFFKNGLDYYLTELSSGELQILYTMSCLATNITNNSLILFDEPDLSLHPSWQISYLSFIKNLFKDFSGCHLILATHSHYLISDLEPNTSSLVTITRDYNKRIIETVDYSTYAWSAENILYNVFKVRTTRNYYFQKDLDRLMYLIGMNTQNDNDKDEINKLIEKLEDYKYDNADPLNLILKQAKGYIHNV